VKFAPTFPELSERWVSNPLARARRVVGCCARHIRSVYRAYPAVVSGAVFGLVVPLLGQHFAELGGMHTLVGHHAEPSATSLELAVVLRRLLCVPFGWTILAGWLSHSLGCGYSLPALMLVSVACASCLFWVASAVSGWVRRHGTTGRVVACAVALVIAGGYVWTWLAGGNAVRDAIRQACSRTQTLAHMRWPDAVPDEPIGPEIYYCFPVVPGLLVSEHCFLYGPLMGDGGQDLWFWDGKTATAVYGLCMWNH
jgi:hypothetical protein